MICMGERSRGQKIAVRLSRSTRLDNEELEDPNSGYQLFQGQEVRPRSLFFIKLRNCVIMVQCLCLVGSFTQQCLSHHITNVGSRGGDAKSRHLFNFGLIV